MQFLNETAAQELFTNQRAFKIFVNRVDLPLKLIIQLIEVIVSTILRDNRYRFNDSLISMTTSIMMIISRIVIRISIERIYGHLHIMEVAVDTPFRLLVLWFCVDFFFYWYHRAMHEVNILWSYHQVHHSSEYMNLSTAFRQPVLQTYVNWLFYTPLAFFVEPSMLLLHVNLNSIFQHVLHTEYIRSLGPLEYIMNTPSHHRVHHGRNPYCIDKNYAGVFIIWDRMFGTFVKEGPREVISYGLVHPVSTFDPISVQYGYLKYLTDKFRASNGVFNKLCVIFYGPGWNPGKPRTGDVRDIPEVEVPIQRYDVFIPNWLKLYIAIHFVLGLSFVPYLGVEFRERSLVTSVFLLMYAYYSFSCAGRLLDQSKYCHVLETFRCLSVIGLGHVTLQWMYENFESPRIIPLHLILTASYLSLIFWTAYFIKQIIDSGMNFAISRYFKT